MSIHNNAVYNAWKQKGPDWTNYLMDKESLAQEGLHICNAWKKAKISKPPQCAHDVDIDTYLPILEEILRLTGSLTLAECLSSFLEHDFEEHPDWWYRHILFKSIVQAGFPELATNKVLPKSIADDKQNYYINLCWRSLSRFLDKNKVVWEVISSNTFDLLYKTATNQTPWVDKKELLKNIRRELDVFVETFRAKNGGSWDLSMEIG